MDLLIKGGTVVTASASFKADVAVKNGKITAIAANLKPEQNTEVVDAKGKLVLPGAIDGHTHLAMPFGGTISTDDYYAGTRSAACGGTTTVFDFVLQGQGEPMLDAIKRRDALAAPDAAVDYSFHIGVGDVTTDEMLNSMEDAVKYGVTSFKVFMVYDFGVDDGQFFKTEKGQGAWRSCRCSRRKQRCKQCADCSVSGRGQNGCLVALHVQERSSRGRG